VSSAYVLITYWRRNPEPNLTGRRGGRAQISRCITALRLFRRSSFSLIFHTNLILGTGIFHIFAILKEKKNFIKYRMWVVIVSFKRSLLEIFFVSHSMPDPEKLILWMTAVLYVGCAAKCEKGLKNNNSPFA
jgi:hypothetical protein